jgi:hypothetical protein
MSGSYLRPVSGEVPVTAGKPKRVVFVDESPLYAESWRAVLACRYGPAVSIAALDALGPDVSLLLVDLELPLFGGRKLFERAKERGVTCRRIVILSSRPAEDLHQLFPDGSCLAVINKTEANQQNAFLMILDSIVKRH